MALEAIVEVNEQYKADHISNILIGNKTAAVKSFNHYTLNCFGDGKDHDERFWNAVFRQSMIAGLITKDIENYGLLKMTEKGHEFIKNPTSFMLVKKTDAGAGAAHGGGRRPEGRTGPRQLGGAVHAIEGMSPVFIGLAQGQLSSGADTSRPVVRAVYLDPNGHLILLDQQQIRPGQRAPVATPDRWPIGSVLVSLHGEASPQAISNLRTRLR